MAMRFVRGLRRGVITTRYPHKPDTSSLDLPTPPAFHPSLLTVRLADRLVHACPAHCLERTGDVLTIDLGACTGCGTCINLAGDAAQPSGHWDLATWDRRALVRDIPIRGRDGD